MSVPPCTQGYAPRERQRLPEDLTDGPIFPARCTSGPPYSMRGRNYVPGAPGNPSPARDYLTTSYDPATGYVAGVTDERGRPVRMSTPGDLSLFGDEAWKWMVVGPTLGE
jgi:phospholipid/cholesterol/gamma-HCH transport system substrate-binding protein